MRFGISPFATNREMVTRLARTAVEGRLDTLWLGDGLLENSDFPVWAGGMESFTELAWLAGAFPDARIGITAAVLPLRDVLWVAKQAATLDHLCDGEFVLAVTPGFWEREFAYLGLDFAARGRVFEERVAELRDLLAARPGMGGPSPPPLTSGGPPMWLAGAEATMKRALRLGMPYQASPTTPEALAPAARRWFAEGGGPLGVRVRMEIGRAAGGDEAVPWNLLSGTPARLADHLAAFAALGVSDVSIIPGQDDETSLRTVEALAEHVVPQVSQAGR